jgi:glycopeptide antibiotics resistance protein
MRNARGNVALFIPLGFLIPLVWPRRRFWSGLQIALAVSISIEVLQYLSRPWSNRLADVNDVILNVAGAAIGLAVVSLVRWRPRARAEILLIAGVRGRQLLLVVVIKITGTPGQLRHCSMARSSLKTVMLAMSVTGRPRSG